MRRLARSALLGSLVLAALGVGSLPAWAAGEPCGPEVEPNDAPEDRPVVGGPLCIAGTLPESDQDIVVWDVAEADARQAWTVSLDGVDDTLTSVRFIEVTSEPGVEPLTPGATLLQVDSGPDAIGPVVLSDVILRPGRLIVGVARSGTLAGGAPLTVDYELRVEPGAPLPPAVESEPNDDVTAATALEGAFDVGGDLSGSNDLYAWTVPAVPDGEGWTVELTGPVRQGTSVTLATGAGETLTYRSEDASGHTVLPDLVLEPGPYVVTVAGASEGSVPYRLRAVAAPLAGDAEPNDAVTRPVPLDPADPVVRGRLFPAYDADRFLLRIPSGEGPLLRDVKARWDGDLARRVCVSTLEGTDLQCRDGTGGAVLRSLALPPADYLVTISGDPDADRGYLLRVDTTSSPAADFETEPNDRGDVATPFDPTIVMRGLGALGDVDLFRLAVSGEPQLYELRLSGSVVNRLAWTKADGSPVADGFVEPGRASALLTDVYLVPGEHWFRVEADGEYQLAVTALGPPDPNAEREPNNGVAYAEGYRLGRDDIVGRLPSGMDADVFRFTLAAPERIVLTVEPPADGAVDLFVEQGYLTLATRRAAGPGVATRAELLLEPGDYEVWLRPSTPSSDRYRLSLERADPLVGSADEEPNDDVTFARPLPPSLTASGSFPVGDGADWYALPPIDPSVPVTVHLTPGTSAAVSDGTTDLPATVDDARGLVTTDGTSGLVPRYLRVTGYPTDYELTLEAPGLSAVAPPPPLPVEARLVLETDAVAAYWPEGQEVAGTLELTGTGEASQTLALDTLTSHFAWHLSADPAAVTVDPGQTVSVPVELSIEPDAWADDPVRVEVRARDAAGAQVTASATVVAERDAEPVSPRQAWSVPDALLGGLDVASLALGAMTIPSVDQASEDSLHDGIAHSGTGFIADVTLLPLTLTVDLAGDAPVPVAGFILDPLGGDGLSGAVPRDVEFLLSTDGATWTPILEGQLSTLMEEQAFVLPEAVPATHAQLRIVSARGGGFGRVVLGEWKVVAQPGVAPVAGPIDIAQPVRGGHVSWIDPQQGDPHLGDAFLDEEPAYTQLYDPEGPLTFVVGFQDGRAARITRVEWVDPVPSTAGQRFERVEVEVALDGAAGPWRPLGTWTLDRAADGTVAPFELPAPTWARALRFTGTGGEGYYRDPPSTIRVLEEATGSGYRSILGQWGATRPVGPLEWLEPLDAAPAAAGPDAGDTPETAAPVGPGTPVPGRVDARDDLDWYSFTVPADHNALRLDVDGRPVVAVALTLVDAEGFEVPMLFGAGDRPGTVRYEAEVTPGASYRLKVEQPPSSIVFTYDTSGSMGLYLDYVFQAMRAFTADVTPGAEFVRIIPFEEPALLDDWSDDPYALQNAVDRYVMSGGSSSAETALITASTELSAREGARAILVVTDAETSSFQRSTELWKVLSSVRPLVFAVHVGATSEVQQSTDFMQDWAGAAGGFYQYTRSHGEMDRAFDRLATWLRRPASYTLALSTRFEEKPPPSQEPGTVAVASPGDGTQATIAPDVAVEIILDTSGSMLQKIRGERRIDIARDVMRDLLGQRIPAGTAVALRTFGSPDDPCGTELSVPLGPLDPGAMTGLIDRFEVVEATNTPIGAALARVPDDLAGSTGTKIVVLVTDGEETCEGNPGAAIRDLRRRGIDARVNLVGFALTDKKVKATMRKWARSGNGTYFDAKGREELGRALRLAVSAPFRILDASGNEVASGTVDGAPVAVPPGTYSVVVLTDPVIRFDDVVVEPGASAGLTLPEPAPPAPSEPAASGPP